MLVCKINFARTDAEYIIKFRCRRNMVPKKIRIPINTTNLEPYASELCQHISDRTEIIPLALRDYQIFQLINVINSQILNKVLKSVVTFNLEIQSPSSYTLPITGSPRYNSNLSMFSRAQELLK